jgi:hypothetical protein
MSLLAPLKNYCERTGEGLWGEPLNAISNIAFFIAAWALYERYRKAGHKDIQTEILISLVAIVGVGSTLFHTFANGLTMIFDVVPIAAFTFYYLWVALRRLVGLTKLKSAIALIGFIIIASQMRHVPDGYRCNGSVDYFPCLGALFIIGFVLKLHHHASASWLLGACVVFMVSLSFRSVDFLVCPLFPFGTHFMWHSLNGLMLYLLVRALLEPKPSIN